MTGTPHNYFAALLEQTGMIGFCIMMYFFWCIFIIIKPNQILNKDTVISYTFFLFFIILMIFNAANVYMYSTINFIAGSFYFFGVAVAHASFTKNKVFPNDLYSHAVGHSI